VARSWAWLLCGLRYLPLRSLVRRHRASTCPDDASASHACRVDACDTAHARALHCTPEPALGGAALCVGLDSQPSSASLSSGVQRTSTRHAHSRIPIIASFECLPLGTNTRSSLGQVAQPAAQGVDDGWLIVNGMETFSKANAPCLGTTNMQQAAERAVHACAHGMAGAVLGCLGRLWQ
jgi:hypothetical protein